MPVKMVNIDGIGEVRLVKSSKSKNIRITIDATGKVRVGLPSWTPYMAAEAFVARQRQWIEEKLSDRPDKVIYKTGMHVGKAHTLLFISGANSVRSSVAGNHVIIRHPYESDENPAVQTAAAKTIKKALLNESENLIPQRVIDLATKLGYDYKNISCKHLKTRWGSCSSKKELVFNTYLMQLPWDLIDYVIVHELVHTIHMNHSDKFWAQVSVHLPSYKILRRKMKDYQPHVIPT